MSDKIYEMYDDYKQAMAELLGFIKVRDELAEFIKIAPPEKIRESQNLLAELDKRIEKSEASLAKEYEAYQTKCRLEEELEAMLADAAKRLEMIFIYVKHRVPEKLDELKTTLFANWTAEEIDEFYDNIAILEATRLEEIIAEAKDNETSPKATDNIA